MTVGNSSRGFEKDTRKDNALIYLYTSVVKMRGKAKEGCLKVVHGDGDEHEAMRVPGMAWRWLGMYKQKKARVD